jgi:hypothetical protein
MQDVEKDLLESISKKKVFYILREWTAVRNFWIYQKKKNAMKFIQDFCLAKTN